MNAIYLNDVLETKTIGCIEIQSKATLYGTFTVSVATHRPKVSHLEAFWEFEQMTHATYWFDYCVREIGQFSKHGISYIPSSLFAIENPEGNIQEVFTRIS